MPDSAATLAWLANFGALELHPWTSTIDAPERADVGAVRHRPRPRRRLRQRRRAGPPAPHRPRAPRRRRPPEGDRQARHPDLGARRSRLHVHRDPGLGRDRLAGDRCDLPGARQLGMGGATPRRPDPARLHPERDQQDARRPLQHTTRRRRARLGADHVGRPRRRPAAPGPLDHPRRPTTPAHRPATRWRRSSAANNACQRSDRPWFFGRSCPPPGTIFRRANGTRAAGNGGGQAAGRTQWFAHAGAANGSQCPDRWARRSATTTTTAGLWPRPRWLPRTSTFSWRPAARSIDVRHGTMVSERL